MADTGRLPRYQATQMRERLWRAADGLCERCGREVELHRSDLGHIVPVAAGGDNSEDNLRLECWACNRGEGGRISGQVRRGDRAAPQEAPEGPMHLDLGGLVWAPPLLALGHSGQPGGEGDRAAAELELACKPGESLTSPLFTTPITPGAANGLGDYVAVAEELGIDLLPWQRWVLRLGSELDGEGLPAHRQVAMSVGRQQGKTTLLGLLVAHHLFREHLLGRRGTAIWVGSDVGGTLTLWEDSILPVWEAAGLNLDYKRGARPRVEVNFSQRPHGVVHLRGGQSKLSGVGATCRLVVLDECWSMDGDVEASATPVTRSIESAQVWMASSYAPKTTPWWMEKTAGGRREGELARMEGRRGQWAYVEWGPEPGADVHAEQTWRAALPAVDDPRAGVSMRTLRTEHAASEPETWAHSLLNARPLTGGTPAIATADWAECLVPESEGEGGLLGWLAAEGEVHLAVDVPPPGEGETQLGVLLGVAGDRACVLRASEGVAWMPSAIQEVQQQAAVGSVSAMGKSPCRSFIEREVVGSRLVWMDTPGYGAACARLHEAIKAGGLVVADPSGALTTAAHTAVARNLWHDTGWAYFRSHRGGSLLPAWWPWCWLGLLHGSLCLLWVA